MNDLRNAGAFLLGEHTIKGKSLQLDEIVDLNI